MTTRPRLCLSVMVLWLGVAAVQADTFINQSAKVRAADGSNSDGFGYSVAGSTAASGDAMIIGAYNDSDFGLASGSAYVFRKSGSSWIQQAKLLANDGAGADNFGYTVAIAGDFAFVGSPQDDDLGQNSGSVYVYRFNGTSWVQHQKLHASDGVTYDYFGVSVAMTTDTAIVGAWYDDDGGSNTGSAYVFKYQASSGQWTQQAKVTAQTPIDYALFGCSVAISADRVIIGAFQNNSAYVFRNTSGSTWVQEARLTPQVPTASGADRFGCSVAISNGLAIVGAKQGHGYYGSALVYRFNGSTWIQEQELLASDAAFYQGFGTSVSISGNTALIGAPSANSNRGAGYLFTYNGSWVQQSRLIASDGLTGVSFAFSSALFNNQAVIGAYTDPLGTIVSGSAYVFPVSATPPTNTAPVVTISSPATNITVVSGTSITFSGTATDTQSGNLNASLIWTSNLQSPSQIGTGATFAKSNLVVGTHTITASATDPGGLTGSITRTVTVTPGINTPPVVTITGPTNGSSFAAGIPVTFTGTATDNQDGTLTSLMTWTSNLQGWLGTGSPITVSNLSVGTHTITAQSTDSGNLSGSASITLIVAACTQPQICVNPASLNLSVALGQNAANQTFTVSNCGCGTLSYTIGDNQTWLSELPASGTSTGEADTITVSFATSALALGSYSATITVSATGLTPKTIPVTLTVGPTTPSICASPLSISALVVQGQNAANQSFTVANCGGGTLSYTVSDNQTWLSESPASGTSTTETDTITVSFATSALASGSYSATITVSATGVTPKTIPVNLTVSLPTPSICVPATSLNAAATLGLNAPNVSFTVTNCGGGTLSYTISDNQTWLSESPASGTSTGEADTITVSFATTALTAGSYSATITVSAAGVTSKFVTVNLTVSPPPPAICVSPSTFNIAAALGLNPSNQTFTVTNCGSGTLSYTVSDNQSWLSQSFASGTSTGEADTITVNFATSALAAGSYSATITVSAAGVPSGAISVNLTVTALPAAPTNVTVIKLSNDVGKIDWTPGTVTPAAGAATSFEIQREQTNGNNPNLTIVGSTTGAVTTYTDAAGNGTFHYRVRAQNAAGYSAWSAWSASQQL